MKKVIMTVFATLMSVMLVGCDMSNQDAGAITGGVVGGIVGNQVGRGSGRAAATVGGVLLGTYIGSNIGRTMDKVDRMQVSRALETTRTNESYSWRNPDSGYRYRVRPVETYTHHEQSCRRYVTEAWIDGERRQIHGEACRHRDGSWHAVN